MLMMVYEDYDSPAKMIYYLKGICPLKNAKELEHYILKYIK